MNNERKIELFKAFKHAAILYRLYDREANAKGLTYRFFFQYLIDQGLMQPNKYEAKEIMLNFLVEFCSGLQVLGYHKFSAVNHRLDEEDNKPDTWKFPFDFWFVRDDHHDITDDRLEQLLADREKAVKTILELTKKFRAK